MDTRPLGESGIDVSVVGLGCNNFGMRIDQRQSRAVVDVALEVGITFFDTADVYGDGDSERFLGEALQGRREQAIVATKFGSKKDERPGGSPEFVRECVHASLRRLGMDTIDVLFYHRPDGVTPLAETLGAMWELVDEGKARAIACSNVSAAQLGEAEQVGHTEGRPHMAAVQNEYSLVNRSAEQEVLPLCHELAVGFVPYFPLAMGLLTGKYRRGEPPPEDTRLAVMNMPVPDEQWDAVETAARFAAQHGRDLLELAISALIAQPDVSSVIAGATRPEQVRANAAAGGWRLGADDFSSLQAALVDHKALS